MNLSSGHIRFLEELSLNALPSLQTAVYDGWLLRFANGFTGRANSIQTLYAGDRPIEEKIAYCRAAYQSRDLKPLFKMTPASYPTWLDTELETRSYRRHSPVSVQTAEIPTDLATVNGIEIQPQPSRAWIDGFLQLRGLDSKWHSTFEQMVHSILPAAAFAMRTIDGAPVAVGMAVVERGWVGLFDIVTDEARRREGHATAVVYALLSWARGMGAGNAYLQVTEGNEAALALYDRLGFREAYTYWYRVAEGER